MSDEHEIGSRDDVQAFFRIGKSERCTLGAKDRRTVSRQHTGDA
jgi:hypothetical protein